MPAKQFLSDGLPYQNALLADLPGEEWKDIYDFEGLYQVSTHGRIKSVQRDVTLFDGKNRTIGGYIRKPIFNVPEDKITNAALYTLAICLNKKGRSYRFPIARLVYCAFVEQFDLGDQSILISSKDKDCRNLHFSNLVKSYISAINQSPAKQEETVNVQKSMALLFWNGRNYNAIAGYFREKTKK